MLLRQSKGQMFQFWSTDLWTGYVKTTDLTVQEGEPSLKWNGAKIPWRLWCEIVSFFRWCYEDYKGEAQLRLAYRVSDRQWCAIVLPQSRQAGMFTKEIVGHPDIEEASVPLRDGFEYCGTAHSHCTAGAFQSGTDSADELVQTGLHVTVGKVTDATVEYHSRCVFRGHQYEADLSDWVELPPTLVETLTAWKLNRADVFKYVLSMPEIVEFPEVWKSRLIAPAPVEPYKYGLTGYGAGGTSHAYRYNPVNKTWTQDHLPMGSGYVPRAPNTLGRFENEPVNKIRESLLEEAFENFDSESHKTIVAAIESFATKCQIYCLKKCNHLSKVTLDDLVNVLSDMILDAGTPKALPAPAASVASSSPAEVASPMTACDCMGTGLLQNGTFCHCAAGTDLRREYQDSAMSQAV